MTADVLLFAIAGILAALSGGAVILLAPGRAPTLLAGGAMALLGLLQIGFARVALDAPWGGEGIWFRHTLTLALPTTTLWVLLSVTLGRRPGAPLARHWRVYLVAQILLAAAALGWSALGPEPVGAGSSALELDGPSRFILLILLLNIVLFSVNFEATYVSFPRRYRRAFRPALLGIVPCAIFYASLSASGLLGGSAALSDIAVGTGPVALLALLLPVSFVRRHLGSARIAPTRHPVTATTSFLLAGTFLIATGALYWISHSWGIGTARGIWVVAVGGVIVGVTLIAFSNRERRRVERALAPIWSDWRGPYRSAVAHAIAPLEEMRTLANLCAAVPANASRIADLESVTLLLAHRPTSSFRVVSSTLAPVPETSVLARDPLALELRRARRAIRLSGRPDDLEYVSIYVENREAITACGARVAVPVWGDEE
ncbi:MAG TPA: hypothetical protein VLT84_02885, partial [Acidobacteriota bacterium]|nr:hypothetical protein [Acidobacteriota bacterium]